MGPSVEMRTICTAGHVDHGKSTLIQALTGMNPDRLQEEIDRQMTIDLGFAWLMLENGKEVGIIDVPGHRDFIDNMLAGVGSIDAVLFVIAADEGIMPQTHEHLAILDLLQVPRGIVVLSKIDLVDEEWLSLVEEEVEDLISSTTLNGAPIIPVSASKGIGLERVKEQIMLMLESSPGRPNLGRPRLSIDRVFSLTGFGTVVTGTLVGGSLEEGQEVEIGPKGLKARIRNLQSHKTQRESVEPGGRVALNLSGVRKSDIERGDTVVLPGQWDSTTMIDASFRALPDLREPLKHNQEVKLYMGASQRMARIRLIGRTELAPGDEGWIQLVLSDALIADRGDHFILRRPSPGATLGGGQVVDPHPQKRYRQKDRSPIKRLEKLLSGDPADVLLERIRLDGPVRVADLYQDRDHEGADLLIEGLLASGAVIMLAGGEVLPGAYVMAADAWENTIGQSHSLLSEYHIKNPLRAGMPVQEYRTRMNLDPKWVGVFMEEAVTRALIEYDGKVVREPTFSPTLTQPQLKATSELLEQFQSDPYNTPSRREILEQMSDDLLQYLLWKGELVSLGNDVFLNKETYHISVERIKEVLDNQGTVTIAQVRDLFQTTRKYALGLMEHLDEIGLTVREGDVRRLLD